MILFYITLHYITLELQLQMQLRFTFYYMSWRGMARHDIGVRPLNYADSSRVTVCCVTLATLHDATLHYVTHMRVYTSARWRGRGGGTAISRPSRPLSGGGPPAPRSAANKDASQKGSSRARRSTSALGPAAGRVAGKEEAGQRRRET